MFYECGSCFAWSHILLIGWIYTKILHGERRTTSGKESKPALTTPTPAFYWVGQKSSSPTFLSSIYIEQILSSLNPTSLEEHNVYICHHSLLLDHTKLRGRRVNLQQNTVLLRPSGCKHQCCTYPGPPHSSISLPQHLEEYNMQMQSGGNTTLREREDHHWQNT